MYSLHIAYMNLNWRRHQQDNLHLGKQCFLPLHFDSSCPSLHRSWLDKHTMDKEEDVADKKCFAFVVAPALLHHYSSFKKPASLSLLLLKMSTVPEARQGSWLGRLEKICILSHQNIQTTQRNAYFYLYNTFSSR